MFKYFKIVEISEEEFINATNEEIDCCHINIPTSEGVFVAVDEACEYDFVVPLDCFE